MFFFLIIVTFILLSLGHKESRPLLYILYFLLFIVSVGVSGGNDVMNDEIHFDNPFAGTDSEDRSYVYEIYMMFIRSLGLDFLQFRIVNFFIWSIPLLCLLFKYSRYPVYVFALCFFFPILTFASQMRNGTAMSFLYWGLYLYFTNNKKLLGGIGLAVCLFIACVIHSVSYVYFVCFIALSRKIGTVFLLRVCTIVAALFFFFISSGLLYEIVALLFSEYYANFYFNEIEPFSFGNSNVFVGILINIWFTYKAAQIQELNNNKMDNMYISFSHFVLRLNILLLAFCPLMLISLTFYRIYQNVYFLSAMSVANAAAYNLGKGKTMSNLYVVFYFIVTFFYIYGQGEFLLGWDNLKLL